MQVVRPENWKIVIPSLLMFYLQQNNYYPNKHYIHLYNRYNAVKPDPYRRFPKKPATKIHIFVIFLKATWYLSHENSSKKAFIANVICPFSTVVRWIWEGLCTLQHRGDAEWHRGAAERGERRGSPSSGQTLPGEYFRVTQLGGYLPLYAEVWKKLSKIAITMRLPLANVSYVIG